MKRKLTRRELLKAGGGGLAAVYLMGLTACGGGGGGGDQGGGQLRMAWWGSEARHKRTRDALALFQKNNPEIRVATEYADFEQYWTKIATQASGGNAPDVMQTDYRYLSEYAGRGVLLELDEYIPDTLDLSKFDKAVLEGGKIDGKTIGVTLGNNAQMFVYDVGRFEEAGVDAPNAEWTWEQFAEAARQLAEAGGEGFFGTEDHGGTEPLLEVFVRQRDLELYNEEGTLGFDKDILTEYFTYWEDLRNSGAAAPGDVQSTVADIESTLVVRGQAAMVYSFSNQFTALTSATERPLDLVVVPNGPEDSRSGQYLKPSMLISGYSRSDNPDEAVALMSFFLNNPEANEILGTERGISGNSEVREILRGQVPEEEQKVFEFIEMITETASPLPSPPPQGAGEVDALLTRTNEDISFGRRSIGEAVDGFFSEAERILGAG